MVVRMLCVVFSLYFRLFEFILVGGTVSRCLMVLSLEN